jgi:hypothetical protein
MNTALQTTTKSKYYILIIPYKALPFRVCLLILLSISIMFYDKWN